MNKTISIFLIVIFFAFGFFAGQNSVKLQVYKYGVIASVYYATAVVAVNALHPDESIRDAKLRIESASSHLYQEMKKNHGLGQKSLQRVIKKYKTWDELLEE